MSFQMHHIHRAARLAMADHRAGATREATTKARWQMLRSFFTKLIRAFQRA